LDLTIDRGGRPSSEEKYSEALKVIISMKYLPMTLSEVARMCKVSPEGFRRYVRLYYPDILEVRNAYREALDLK